MEKPIWDIKFPDHVVKASGASITFDEKTGNYIVRWKSYDGKRLQGLIWEPQTKINAYLQCEVRPVSESHDYEYRYRATNGKASKQKLMGFHLVQEAPVHTVTKPDEGWFATESQLFSRDPEPKPWTANAPSEGGKSRNWTDTLMGRLGIPPGKSQSGFSFRSAGLPGVTPCYATGYTEGFRVDPQVPCDEEPADGVTDALPRKLWQNGVFGQTVGPGEIPKADTPKAQDLLAKMLDYTQACVEQGWIDAPALAEQFRGLLTSAKQAVEQGNTPQASATLLKVIETVDAHSSPKEDKGLTSEAVALLKINAEFLRERMK